MSFLYSKNILLKNFGDYAKSLSGEIEKNMRKMVEKSGREYIYLNSYKISKEKTALEYLKNNPIEEGLVCVIGVLETCNSLDVKGNKSTHKLEIISKKRKCLNYYFYYLDREFGWMHVKLQTWFPFGIQIYINGREYVAKQLDKESIKYSRYDNCFTDIENLSRAVEIAGNIESKDWSNIFNRFAHEVNPILKTLEESFNNGYYWCVDQCEYATDIMFKKREDLELIYPNLVEHAITNFSCEDVMTFLGRKIHPLFLGEIVSDVKKRQYGVRIKHRMKKNSIKMYDKNSVLRIETTINDPKEFKIYKDVIRKGVETKAWVPMGKSISNLYRYAQVSEASNKRYLDALCTATFTGEQVAEIEKLSEKIVCNDREYSGFNLFNNFNTKVFEAVMNGNNLINGFRNSDILKVIFKGQSDKKQRNKVTRLLAKLKAHGLISKIKASFRYKTTVKGLKIMSSILTIKKKELPISL